VTGLLLLVGAPLVLAEFYQHEYEAPLPQPPALPAPPVAERILPSALPTGEAIGTLEIVRLGLSGVVAEGDTDAVLDRAIGHVRDTPLPWQEGNSALAAHRDRIFRPLRGIRSGDIVRLKTPHGDFDYEVHDTLIVKPEDVWVLDPTGTTMLTLISCFPFNYIGSAPERFIVRAQRIPPAPYVLRIGKPGA
jgi:sortase A